MSEPQDSPNPQGTAPSGQPYVPSAAHGYYPPQQGQQYPPPYGPPGVPPAFATPYGPAPGQQPAKKSRAWVWWVAGLAIVALFFGGLIWIGSTVGARSGGFVRGRTIAVIPFDGTIAGTSGATNDVITPQEFLKLLQRAEDDDNVKAIVLRVDSPGGTVAASEEIATYVKQCKKPIVVSVGDVDASGAYMVSSQASKIVANPGSAVGSIGVITEIPNVTDLLNKVGVQFKVITAGKYKDAGSPFRPLTPSETALIQGQVDEVYGQFVDLVASGRKMKRPDVEKLATGWAWNGVEAKKLGLVDQIGTYRDALDVAAKLGKIEGHYETDVYEKAPLGGVLSALLGIERQLQNISAMDPTNPSSLGRSTLAK